MKAKAPKPVIIKKYENRRLYNTETSQYINQEQIAQLVRDGHDLRVIDVATGDDITRLILAQIVLEDARTPDSVFPLDVLRQMVLASGKATQENALRYFKTMMDMYQTAYRAIPSPLNPMRFMPTLWPQPAEEGTTSEPQKTAPEPAATSQSEASSEVDELRRRVEEMEAAMSRRNRRPKGRKPKSRRRS
jgi:polyhydroxyalkanoate synthesis repressor PhaR